MGTMVLVFKFVRFSWYATLWHCDRALFSSRLKYGTHRYLMPACNSFFGINVIVIHRRKSSTSIYVRHVATMHLVNQQ